MIVKASSKRAIRWSNGKAVRPELWLVPARSEAEHEPAAAQLVDGRGLFCEQGWIVEGRAGDERPELDTRGRSRDRSEHRPGFPWPAGSAVLVAVEEVFADPDGVEPEILDRAGHVEEFGPAHVPLDLGELDADLDRAVGIASSA